MLPPESPPPILQQDILTGHYREVRGYRAWRERGTDDWLLILTLDGSGRFGHPSGVEIQCAAGDAVLLAPATRHDYGVARGAPHWEILWSHFYPRPGWDELLTWPEEAPGLHRLSLREPSMRQRITDRLLEMHRHATGPLVRHNQFAMNALEEAILWCSTCLPEVNRVQLDARIEAAVAFIRHQYRAKLSLEDVSSAAGVSPSRLTQLFRIRFGSTVVQYLESHRMASAKQLLLRTSLSIEAVAAEVGFENPFYFSSRFKRLNGLAPSHWRARQSGRGSSD